MKKCETCKMYKANKDKTKKGRCYYMPMTIYKENTDFCSKHSYKQIYKQNNL